MHVVGMYKNNTNLSELNQDFIIFVNSVGNVGVTCFVLISGYFGITWKANKWLHLIWLTICYALIVSFMNYGIGKNLFQALLSVFHYKPWFIACYLILMMISPALNLLSYSLSKEAFLKLLISLFLVFCIIPIAFNNPWATIVSDGGKCLQYVIFIYLVGRYIRFYKNVFFSNKALFILIALLICFIYISDYLLVRILYKFPLVVLDCSPLIFTLSICIFYLFKGFSFFSSGVNWLSRSVLAIYLLDESRIFFNQKIVHLDNMVSSFSFIGGAIVLVFEVAIFSISIDKLRNKLLGKIEVMINNKISSKCIQYKAIIIKKLNEVF